MTPIWQGRDRGLGPALTRLARPGILLVAYRWRYELGIVLVMLAGLAAGWWAGPEAAVAGLATVATAAALATTRPEFRAFVAARAWCIITPHRVRTCFAQAWVHNRGGRIPAVLRTKAQPFGERVLLWCRAGISAEDIESVSDLLAAACWASDVLVSRSERFAPLVYLDVIRRPQWQATTDADPEPAEPDVPPWPRSREWLDRSRLTGLPGNDDRQGAA
jgi:hypothetical protein